MIEANIKIIKNKKDNSYDILIDKDYIMNIQRDNTHVYCFDSVKMLKNYFYFNYSEIKKLLETYFYDIYLCLFLLLNIVEFDLVNWRSLCFDKATVLYQKLEFLNDATKLSISKAEDIEEFLNYMKRIINVYKNFSKFKKLFYEKKEALKSLKYVCLEDDLKKFDNAYETALVNCDISSLDSLIAKVEQGCLQKWTGATTNVEEYKSGESFRFLCHSVIDYNFRGKFRTKYVSCSLLFDKYLAYLNSGYGFILPANNIIAASDIDLQTFNATNDKTCLFPDYYSDIKIRTPEEIMDLCVKRKEENKDLNTWNEIVVEGFDPLAIFCLTDGSKELDPRYNGAYELKKHFPKLKVVEIDETLYLPEEKQLELLDRLIAEINLVKQCCGTFKGFFPIVLFKKFWQEFMILKKNGDYSTEDILKLYDLNVEELLNDELTATFLDSKLYTCLNYMLNCFFNSLSFGDYFISDSLNSLYNKLKKFDNNPRLDEYVTGLSEFLKLYENITTISEEYLGELKRSKSLIEINTILKKYLDSLNMEGNSSSSQLLLKK